METAPTIRKGPLAALQKYAIVTAAGIVAWRASAAWLRRRRRLREGSIRALRSSWRQVDGARMHARVCDAPAPRGIPPVVLVHGWGISSSYLVPAAERLAVHFAVYAPDLPGHGKSDTPAEPLDVGGLAQALLRWMDAAGITRASLVGHSMGSQVAVEAAIRHPERVDRLVLIGPTPDPAARSTAEQFRRFLLGGMYERASVNRHLVVDYWRMGRRLVPEYRSMLDDRMEEKLKRLRMPTMLVRGEYDTIAPQAWLEEAARLAGAARTVVIPGWGHAVHYSAPAQLTEAIRPFLNEPFGSVRRAGAFP